MNEEYEIIFITEEGRAIKNNKTGKIYHSEFEIIDEKNKQIKDLQQKVEQLEKENKELKEDNIFLKTNLTKLSSKYIKNDLLNILNKGE